MLHREMRAAVELATEYSTQLRFAELATHTHTELAREGMHTALQVRGELAIAGKQLEPAIGTWHGTDRDEPTGEPPRQAASHSRRVGEGLARGTVTEKRACIGLYACTYRTPIEPQLISGSDAGPEHGDGAVDGDAAGADPLFHFAPRCETGPREHLLQSLGGRLPTPARARHSVVQ
jgi:hypothetical protein